jgi:SAM-dependent methyltransferase
MAAEGVEYRVFPEMRAGGFCRVDHRMEYIVRVNALLRPDMVVLDFGAGRGKWQYDPVPLRRFLGDFRGRCAKVIGADADDAIMDNPQVDERIRLEINRPIPLPDESVDLISAFSVFEHIEDAAFYAAELTRILRPGGWICGWTPNKWGYVGIGARLVPKPLHALLLRLLEPRREEHDSFPPVYRMNTRGHLRKLFPAGRFDDCSYGFDGQPFYHFESSLIARLWRAIFWALPPFMRGFHMVFLHKAGQSPSVAQPWPLAADRIAVGRTQAGADV